uniref:ATP synthase epsilon chain n=1 Tax=Candidatus Kentrum eta TaxID=2126337 RepID=A0A450VD34_9GAMM|nr:MAG: ATP synthase F1 subcomplex epsilon subunit [Candidatus Kentron sp. H]VFJ97356.1 MAG: ATP synthase F1 subcomplex epsilon subunit [Candidatus Kentron sp. H]VFK02678.1 MAG: ATP synthase F1 subcomplex epsilon subunit [Candidatus Kentron sp. H]
MDKKPKYGRKNKTIHVDIVSAEGVTFTGPAYMIIVPTVMGDVGILPGHSPLLAQLKPGEIRIDISEEELLIYTSGGFMEIQSSVVTVLSDTALRADAIDEAAVLAIKRQAEASMLQQEKSDFDYAKARNELAQAVAQLRTLEDAKKRARKGSSRKSVAHHPSY